MTDALADALRPIVAALVAQELARQAPGGTRPGLLTIPEACAALGGISRPSIYSLLNAGTLRSVHVGRRRLIPAAAIADYIAGQSA